MIGALLPLTYRAAEVEQIFRALQAGDSCLIVGIGSVGKSNLLRFLLQEDLRRERLGQDWERWLFVYVDANKLLRWDAWGLYELVLHQLLIELTGRQADAKILETINDLHRRASEGETQHLALRYLDRALTLVCKSLGHSLALLLDEFDELGRRLPPQSFSALRALRDEHKYRLVYVAAARAPLAGLPQKRAEIEPFEELVSDHIIWLNAYSEADARLMLERIAARFRETLGEEQIQQALRLAGGHPGLLRAGFRLARQAPGDLPAAFDRYPEIHEECQRIWRSLPEDEQRALLGLAALPAPISPAPELLARLGEKGLVGGTWRQPEAIFSLLFEAFIRQYRPVAGAHVTLDRARRVVWVDGRSIEDLSPLEFSFLVYLVEHRGEVCTRDDLALHLYGDEGPAPVAGQPKKAKRSSAEREKISGVSDEMLDSIVKRLRKRLEVDPNNPVYILTIRGIGFRLADPLRV